MSAFLSLVADHIHEHYKDNVEKLCIVLPNKRGALFLKQHLGRAFGKTIWLPTIISAEELIGELSGLRVPEEIDLICHLYESYKASYGEGAETFDSFAKWGQLILQDFNEIDRYLAPPEQLYENLKDIKVIENWSLGEENLTEYQQNYLQFMKSIGGIYKHYTQFLLANQIAYPGLAYRQAVAAFRTSNYPAQFHQMIFCGFNALNAAELKIFHGLYTQKKAIMLWDADSYYLNNPELEAGFFLRKNFELFKEREPSFIEENFKKEKNIRIVSVPKQLGQAQVIKQTLQRYIREGVQLDKVAVVLANEKLLWPVLQQLPPEVQHVNITMEYPLRYTSTYSLVEQLIQLQTSFGKQTRKHKTIYHKDLTSLFRQPLFRNYIKIKAPELNPSLVVSTLTSRNLAFITSANLHQLLGDHYPALREIFQPAESVGRFCDLLLELIKDIIDLFSQKATSNHVTLELEYLYIFLKNLNRLKDIITRYDHFSNMAAFRQLFVQTIGYASAPFIGEPLRGLQIMGVLETRTLDFDHVIFVNVNEGVLPAGKTINSFIPNDLKHAFGLPLYLEKDAIYSYHFYRMLQKAHDITITYDSETDTFGKGEKSRFVTQLQMELRQYNPKITISEEIASYNEFPAAVKNVITIQKNETVLSSILSKATSSDKFGGLSPSGLTTFKECSLKFYFRYGVHLKETEEVEESAEANTFGSILHLALETLYKPLIGTITKEEDLKKKHTEAEEAVNTAFLAHFHNHEPMGKSLLQREVIKVYVKKLIDHDLKFITGLKMEGHHLSVLHLEHEFSAFINVGINKKEEQIFIKGKIDRIDTYKGLVRIIDYKSSVKDTDKFAFEGFEKLLNDKNYNKQLQLFIYAWLVFKNGLSEPGKLVPCIIPFKVFSDEPKYLLGADKKPIVFTQELMRDFENELVQFIGQIFNVGVPFDQTEDEKAHEYCPYNTICNFRV